ncbi:hypothetical protein B0H10DRAFT_1841973, partial [Mycena sp. CBHHK59/15]
FLTQIPQPMHKNSEMKAILSVGLTSMQSFPGMQDMDGTHPFLRQDMTVMQTHRFGLHLFASTMAIRVILSAMAGCPGQDSRMRSRK